MHSLPKVHWRTVKGTGRTLAPQCPLFWHCTDPVWALRGPANHYHWSHHSQSVWEKGGLRSTMLVPKRCMLILWPAEHAHYIHALCVTVLCLCLVVCMFFFVMFYITCCVSQFDSLLKRHPLHLFFALVPHHHIIMSSRYSYSCTSVTKREVFL